MSSIPQRNSANLVAASIVPSSKHAPLILMDANRRAAATETNSAVAGNLAAAQHLHELLEARRLWLNWPTVRLGWLLHTMLLVHRPLR